MGRRTATLISAAFVASLTLPAFASAFTVVEPVALPGTQPPQNLPPAASIPACVPVEVSVAVLPFRVLKPDAGSAGLSEGLQQAVLSQLNAVPSVKLYHLPGPAGGQFESNELAIAAAKAAGLAVVVVGTYQSTDTEARATAGIYQTSGRLLGIANAKGNPRDLFTLQDNLAKQVRDIVAPNPRKLPSPGPAVPLSPADPRAAAGANRAGGNGVAGLDARGLDNVTPIPFAGSTLERVLSGKESLPPPPQGLSEARTIQPGVPYGAYDGTYAGNYDPTRYGHTYDHGGPSTRPGNHHYGHGRPITPIVTSLTPAPDTKTPDPSIAGINNQRYSETGSPYSAGGPASGQNLPTPPRPQPTPPPAPEPTPPPQAAPSTPPNTIPGLTITPPQRKPRE